RRFGSEAEQTVEYNCRGGRDACVCSRHGCHCRRSIAELCDFFAQEVAALWFWKGKMNIGMPAGALQMGGSNQSVAAIISFAGKDEAMAGVGVELLHCSRDSGSSFVHQRFGGDAAGKGRIFCVAHLRRGNDRRVHCASELTS